MGGDPIRALTGRHRTRPTSTGCRKPQQPEPGRAPLILAQAAVQTNRATSAPYKLAQSAASQILLATLTNHRPHGLQAVAKRMTKAQQMRWNRATVAAVLGRADSRAERHARGRLPATLSG